MRRVLLLGICCALLVVLAFLRLRDRFGEPEIAPTIPSSRAIATDSRPTALSNSARPFDSAASTYYQMLLSQKFSELDAALADAQAHHAVLSDGQPLAAAIYAGLMGCMFQGCEDHFSEDDWKQRGDLLLKWRSQNPGSVAAEISLAGYHLEEAWDIRGGDWASNVAPGAWNGFEDQMKAAEEKLMTVGSEARNDPAWSVAMLDVGIARHWSLMQYEAFFAKAIEEHPDYMMIYIEGCGYYAPRWFGDPQQVRSCIERAVAATKATLGDTMYARVNWSLHSDDMFGDGQADWTQVRSGFERLIADFPDPWNTNKYAYFACQARDARTVLKLAKTIGSEPMLDAWYGSEDLYNQCVGAAKATLDGTLKSPFG